MQNWKGLDIDKKRGGAAIIEALGSKEMAKYSWIFGKYSWIDEYWEHILGNLDIWKRFLAGGKIILDVWTDMEISVTGSDAGKVPTLSFTSEDLIARLHSISFHMIF